MTTALLLAGDATCHADPGIDPAVVHFVVAAKEFCRLLESDVATPRRDLLQQLLTAALALYSAGLAAPEVDPELDTREDPFFDQHARQMFRKQIAERLSSDVPDSESQDSATLADDLSALYLDAKEGLLRIPEHAGQAQGHVIWGWAFGFETHSGRHAIRAISALHSLLFGAWAVS
jgi:hypothetical protein